MYVDAEVRSCRAALGKNVDLTSYTTAEAAEDIDAVRRALHYERIDVWALSYGTRLAQVYMKRHPDRLRRSVLVGFVPLDYRTLFHAANAQRVLDLLFFKCQADVRCGSTYPHLREDWNAVLRSLTEGRAVANGVAIVRGPFAEAVRALMGTAAGQRELPSMIHAAAAGDYAPFLARFPKDSSNIAEGLYLSIACSEGVSRIAKSDLEPTTADTFVGDYRVQQELAACAQWPAIAPPTAFYDPPGSPLSILILGGEMDHVAPPDWGREFCDRISGCDYLFVPDLGHGPFDLEAWSTVLLRRDRSTFLATGRTDASCLRTMRPPKFK